jgi:hypothetical protein
MYYLLRRWRLTGSSQIEPVKPMVALNFIFYSNAAAAGVEALAALAAYGCQ